MKNFYFIAAIATFIVTLITLLASNNLFASGAILILSFLLFFVVIKKQLSLFLKRTYRYKQCYIFINTFIISLSIKESVLSAYQNSYDALAKDFIKEIDDIDHLDVNERLDYLEKFFPFHIYHLFLQILNIYNEQGGDILKMSSHLLSTAREESEYLYKAEQINRTKLIEFSTLWLLTFGIMAFLRIALRQFYDSLSSSLFYVLGIATIMAFALWTFYIAFKRFIRIDIKGFMHE